MQRLILLTLRPCTGAIARSFVHKWAFFKFFRNGKVASGEPCIQLFYLNQLRWVQYLAIHTHLPKYYCDKNYLKFQQSIAISCCTWICTAPSQTSEMFPTSFMTKVYSVKQCYR